jgi:hypothetical protein
MALLKGKVDGFKSLIKKLNALNPITLIPTIPDRRITPSRRDEIGEIK